MRTEYRRPTLKFDRAEWSMAVKNASRYMRPRSSGCVEWTKRSGNVRFKCRPYPVATLVWENANHQLATGPVEQSCRTPFCVNPAHLLARPVQPAVRP